ncbi:MAG: UDP-N-acetylmuramoyl-L-alanyl-D-glutamate--2,6-diaminopimelate ligase [Rhodospirillaceae bacterium]|nr:UDP-N-acetylmuramoyl-L-alanyl-D-glutamate--2,6-diaminopimelate ligase [Rhodospirillaceae bacterium]
MMAAMVATAMSLSELLNCVQADISGIRITDLVSDSRQIQPGAAFLALKGDETHGLEFASEAVERGANVVLYDPDIGSSQSFRKKPQNLLGVPVVAIPDLSSRLGELAARFYSVADISPRLVGITGTNGKSTVAYLAAQAQTLRGYPSAYIGTIGFGIPPKLEPQLLTTPDCLSLHRALAAFNVTHAAIEVSSHALSQDRIAGLEFETAVFTNLSRDHLDYHGNLEDYQATKARLFQLQGLRKAVLFSDDSFAVSLAHQMDRSIEQTSVSLKNKANLKGRLIDSGLQGITVSVSSSTNQQRVDIQNEGLITSPLVGDFNAENLVLALGVLLSWDVPFDEACAVLSACKAPPGRMEILRGSSSQPTVVVDYAHTPEGLERVLNNLRILASADLWCVFGCGGERDAGKRALMGASAARFADHIVITDDNPRGENPRIIIDEIRRAVIDHPDVRIEHDRAKAIREALVRAGPKDLVLVAGKGHETWQYRAGKKHKFEDVAVVKQTLGEYA